MTERPARCTLAGAAQVLRPPEDGLRFLRHHRAGELTLDAGDVTLDGGCIAAFASEPGATRIDCSGCAVVPGFVDCHTHHGLLAAAGDLWAALARAGGDVLGLAQGATIAVDADLPQLAGVRDEDLPLALVASASAAVLATPAPSPVSDGVRSARR